MKRPKFTEKLTGPEILLLLDFRDVGLKNRFPSMVFSCECYKIFKAAF